MNIRKAAFNKCLSISAGGTAAHVTEEWQYLLRTAHR